MIIYDLVANLFIGGVGLAGIAFGSFLITVVGDEYLRRFDIDDNFRTKILLAIVLFMIYIIFF